jgi:hypothetical protein
VTRRDTDRAGRLPVRLHFHCPSQNQGGPMPKPKPKSALKTEWHTAITPIEYGGLQAAFEYLNGELQPILVGAP